MRVYAGGRCLGIIAPPASAVWESTAGRGDAGRVGGVGRIEAGRGGEARTVRPGAAVREGGQGMGEVARAPIYRVAGGACQHIISVAR